MISTRSTKQLTPHVMARIENDLLWPEIKKMAKGICSRWLLVGGKVYRTLIELKYGVNVNAAAADWDILCFDMTKQSIQFPLWIKTRGQGAIKTFTNKRPHGLKTRKNTIYRSGSFTDDDDEIDEIDAQPKKLPMKIVNSARYEYRGGLVNGPLICSDNLPQVDFIDVNDAAQKSNATTWDYFEAVPLDIQAIALDWGRGEIFGDQAMAAIKHQEIRLKNSNKLLPNLDTSLYLRDKATSLGFQINTDAKHRCYCYPESDALLFINGCKCGGK
jgi:hypothetical protein